MLLLFFIVVILLLLIFVSVRYFWGFLFLTDFFFERENLKLGGEAGGEELGGMWGGNMIKTILKNVFVFKLKGSVSTKTGDRFGWQTSPTNHNITFQ